MASPIQAGPLLLYLVVSNRPVRAVLVVELEKDQIPIYYVSHSLVGAEFNCPLIEKFAYSLVLASRLTILWGA